MHRFLRFVRRRWISLLVVCLVLVVLLPCLAATWWGASRIASPPRRGLMDYHKEFLAGLPSRGISLQSFTASDGTPCIVCTPIQKTPPGARGKAVRDELKKRGTWLPPVGASIGNLVLLHGRSGRKEDFLPIAERFCAAGFRCIIPDLPAHGENPAPLATYGVNEAGLPARVLADASRHFHFPSQPAGLVGMSMGGSVAVHAAALPDAPWRAVCIIASFDRFSTAVECQAASYVGETIAKPWLASTEILYWMESGVMMRDINPCLKAPLVHSPVIVALATDDQVTPLSCGRRLFDSFTGSTEKKKVEIQGARHGSILTTSYPLYADLAEWMLVHMQSRRISHG